MPFSPIPCSAAAITLGTEKINSDLQWRLPLIFQCFPAGVVILAVWFLPESPRWLLANGRDAEAKAFLTKYHGNGVENNPVVELEWQEFKESIKLDASDKRWWDYSELVKTHNARWRFLMVILMGVFGQFSGNGLGYFNLSIYKSIGYDTNMQFILNLVNSITSCIGALAGVSLADRMPRRKVLVIGTFVCSIMLAINGGLSAKWAKNAEAGITDLSVGQGALTAYFFFNIIYSFAYTPLQALYPVECLATETRAKGMAMYGVVVSLFSFINLYAGPIALQNIQYNYVFVSSFTTLIIDPSLTVLHRSSSDGTSSRASSGTSFASRLSVALSKSSKLCSMPLTQSRRPPSSKPSPSNTLEVLQLLMTHDFLWFCVFFLFCTVAIGTRIRLSSHSVWI